MSLVEVQPSADGLAKPAKGSRALVALFGTASFVSSGMLFLVQPLIGRQLLPLAGGSPSLWNTAMVFFQAVLLVGYLYAHFNARFLSKKLREPVHLAVLMVPLLLLPVAVPGGWSLGANPVLSTLGVLSLMVGLPFFALTTSSPTLQMWFSRTDHPAAADPYFLYAAGNAGSLLSLVAYPLVIEPRLALAAQAQWWAAGYVLFVVLSAGCAVAVRRSTVPEPELVVATSGEDGEGLRLGGVAWARRGRWVFWGAVPSALMLAVTRHITTDVASFPLLWILPLVIYVTSFIVAFSGRSARLTTPLGWAMRLGIIPLGLTSLVLVSNLVVVVVMHLAWFGCAALLGHLRLAADRPATHHLTEFYAWISLGGVVGGAVTALAAPVLFTSILEYPIIIGLALAMVPNFERDIHRSVTWGLVGIILAIGVVSHVNDRFTLAVAMYFFAGLLAAVLMNKAFDFAAVIGVGLVVVTLAASSGVLFRDRSFFGVYAVREAAGAQEGWTRHHLSMGTTVHGSQEFRPDGTPDLTPGAYYHPSGPLGTPFGLLDAEADVGIVGLGAGGIAGYGRRGDQYTFYEIDPAVVDIALDEELFTYLSDSAATIDIVVGDGRLELAAQDDSYDLLVVDAFNSDAIPIHLMTVEAFETYLDRMAPDATLMLHISNRHFDLRGVVARLSEELDLHTRVREYTAEEAEEGGGETATWIAVSREASAFDSYDDNWYPAEASGSVWTDDHANVLSALN